MSPNRVGVIGPRFLNQVPTLQRASFALRRRHRVKNLTGLTRISRILPFSTRASVVRVGRPSQPFIR